MIHIIDIGLYENYYKHLNVMEFQISNISSILKENLSRFAHR